MAHLADDAGADDARSVDTLDSAAAAFGDLSDFGSFEDDADDEDKRDEDGADDSDDQLANEDGDEGDKPADEKPAIEAPVSLNAEAKAVFAQLPPEAQRVWADTETARNRQVQEATTRAADAQRTATADAARQTAEAQQQFAQQVRALATHYAPQQPNPANYGDDMQAYARDHANWQYAETQHQQLMQQVMGIDAEAEKTLTQQQAQWAQEEVKALRTAVPEWFDEAKGPELKTRLTAIGAELGYDDQAMAQAGASDIKALNTARGWKDKADKYDAIMARQMQGVRANKTARPNAAQPTGSGKAQGVSDSMTRLRKSGDVRDAAAAFAQLSRAR